MQRAGDGTWCADDDEATSLAERDLTELGLVPGGAVIDRHVVRIPAAFPVLGRGHRAVVDAAEAHLVGISGLSSIGRWGGFSNGGVHENLIAGLRAGEQVASALPLTSHG